MLIAMKKFLLFIILCIYTSVCNAFPLKEETMDTITFMRSLVELGNQHKGEKISVIINEFRIYKIPIYFFDYDYTSPFINSEGKGFLECINISFMSPDTDRWPVLTIYINETNCESENFEDNIKAYEGNGEQRADRIKNLFTIKKVEFDFWPVDYSKTDNH